MYMTEWMFWFKPWFITRIFKLFWVVVGGLKYSWFEKQLINNQQFSTCWVAKSEKCSFESRHLRTPRHLNPLNVSLKLYSGQMFALVTYESDAILYFAKHKRTKRNIRYPNQAHLLKFKMFHCSWNKSPF